MLVRHLLRILVINIAMSEAAFAATNLDREKFVHDLQEADRQERLKVFKTQEGKDRMELVTQNSFMSNELHPLPGAPILLVAKVSHWESGVGSGWHGEKSTSPNTVRFRVTAGKGELFPVAKGLEDQLAAGLSEIETTSEASETVSVWLRTPKDSSGSVKVTAEFLKKGFRADFVDLTSKVSFQVELASVDERALENARSTNQARAEARSKYISKSYRVQTFDKDPLTGRISSRPSKKFRMLGKNLGIKTRSKTWDGKKYRDDVQIPDVKPVTWTVSTLVGSVVVPRISHISENASAFGITELKKKGFYFAEVLTSAGEKSEREVLVPFDENTGLLKSEILHKTMAPAESGWFWLESENRDYRKASDSSPYRIQDSKVDDLKIGTEVTEADVEKSF